MKRGIGSVTVENAAREMKERPLIRSDVAGREWQRPKKCWPWSRE